ncbi:hypothetical protein Glove_299g81 [Diversispora epigaea]|uniref:Uncharacterized protein n=1 Tax=Diversispora epigaea TaxID=1348612 RepID=A0A397HWY7_9GLOM|nr:hypothetical protein Glove_299g81 [Diversispora epigaea]
MVHLVFKIKELLLEEPLESLCGASAIYLTIGNNILSSFEQVRDIIERAINSSLLKIEEIERKIKVSEVSTQDMGKLYCIIRVAQIPNNLGFGTPKCTNY